MEPVFSTGQSVRPGAGRGRTTLCRLVFFQTCPATHRQGLTNLVPRCPPGEMSHISRPAVLPSPAVPCSPLYSSSPLQPPAVPGSYPQSPAAPLFPNVESRRGSLTSFLLFLYSLALRIGIIYYRIISFVFDVFPCHSLLSVLTRFGLIGLGIEMQHSDHGGRWVVESRWLIV